MSTDLLLVLPIIICLSTAIIGLAFRRVIAIQSWIFLGGMGALLAASVKVLQTVHEQGILVTQVGNWPAPFGITLVADHLSGIMLCISSLIGFAVAIYSMADLTEKRIRLHVYPILAVLMMGICGSFIAGDLFNLYVWFEVLLIASFILMALGNDPMQLEGAIKYAAINLVGSVFFLFGIGLIYGMTGALNFADLAQRLPLVQSQELVTASAMMLLIAFGLKAALFPLYFWLPASYHTPPVSISAIFAGLLTKVGVYALIRAFTLLFINDVGYTHTLLLWIAGLTMVTGVLGAASQSHIRKILSFHIISQIGYMVMGLALYTPLSLIGTVFYIVHHILVKTNLFLVSGAAGRLCGTEKLKGIGGLYAKFPFLTVLFVIPAFSLAGFPPLSGFWGKLMMARAGFEVGEYIIVAVSLVVGLLTLYSMSKIWLKGFLPDLPGGSGPARGESQDEAEAAVGTMLLPISLLAIGTLVMSFWAAPFYELAVTAANELLNPEGYIKAVLGP